MTCQSAEGLGVGDGEGLAAAALAAAVGLALAPLDLDEAFFAEALQARANEIAPTMEKVQTREAIIQNNMQDKCQKATLFPSVCGGI